MKRTARLTRRQRTAAIVLAVVAACFITLDLGGSSLSSAHSGVRGLLGSLYRGTDAVLGPLRRFGQGVPHAATNESRVRALQHENAALKKQLADAQADRKSAAQLARLQLAATDGRYQVVPARVLAISPSGGFDWTVTLDTGSSSGVKVGQSVTDGNGLVGRVLRADPSTSVVLLAVDPGSGVGGRDLSGGEVGVATGTGATGFTFRPLDPRAKLAVGDRVSTGPAGSSSFVAGLSIGTVSAIRVSADGSTVAALTPTVTADDLDLVGIILSGGQPGTTRAALKPKTQLAGGR